MSIGKAITTFRASLNVQVEAQTQEDFSKGYDFLGGGGSNTSMNSLGMYSPANQRTTASYSRFRGLLYSVVNAISREAAGQPVCLGRLAGTTNTNQERSFRKVKSNQLSLTLRSKGHPGTEWEITDDHPFLDVIEYPNPAQSRWQFTYSFIANLLITGRSYIVGGFKEDGKEEYYSLPTSWVTPVHKDGPYSHFRVQDPSKPREEKDSDLVSAENVGFAVLPDPGNPLGALSPSDSQLPSIQISEFIDHSQKQYFENGIFPSVVVTVGKDPHPDVPGGGIRPRLSPEQRRQVIAAIKKTMQGAHNYGAPAIVDGLIENITRMSATANEMGWDKSEDKVRARILSAFGVHPMILGEKEVTNYATAFVVEQRFYKIVNSYLDILSTLMTRFLQKHSNASEKEYVWWTPLEAVDQQLRFQMLRYARQNDDMTQNELRAELGLPPNEGEERSKLLNNPSSLNTVIQLNAAVSNGTMPREAAISSLMLFFRISEDQATSLIGDEIEESTLPVPLLPSPEIPIVDEEEEEEETDEQEVPREESDLLRMTIGEYCSLVIEGSK